jgi:hypothetical protein
MMFVNESDEEDEVDSNALMLQLVNLAKSGVLQKLFPEAESDTAKLEELQASLVTESFEDDTLNNPNDTNNMKQNTANFVAAYNDMSVNRDPKDLAKIEALLDSVGCNYESDVTIAVAYDKLSTEQQQTIHKLLGIDFVNEDTNEAKLQEQWDSMPIEDKAWWLYNIHQEVFKDAQLDDTQTNLLNKKFAELTDAEKSFVANRFAFIDEAIELNNDSNLNIDYLTACWQSLDATERFELLDNAGIKDADKLNDVEQFANIDKESQVAIAKAFIDAGKAQADLVVDEADIADETPAIWDAADDAKRAEICKQALMNDDEEAACKGKKFAELDAKLQKLVDTGISLLDEASEFNAEQWWYNASVADRQVALDAVKDFKIGVEDAANATWEMFDNESQNAIEAAIKASGFVAESKEPDAAKISEEAWKSLSNPEKAELLDALKLDIANISKDWSDLSDDIKASIVDSCKDENVLDSASAWGKKIKDAYDNFTELDESVKDFDEVEIGEKVETTLGVGSIIAKGTGLHEFAEACKMHKPNAGISMTELRKRFDDSFDVHWLIVDVAGKCFVDLYGKSHTFVNESSVDESVEAWNAATVEQRKQWLLAKNYLLADAEYNASQDFENLGVETQNFVKEFFAIDESFKDTKLVDKCPVKLGNNIIGFIEQGEPIETNIIAAEDGGALRVEVWPKGKSALKQIVVVAPNDKEWLLESEEDDEVENWWNALSTEARKAIVGDTEEDFDMSFDELSDALKEVANKAFDTSKLDESIASDNVYKNRLNDEQRELVDNFVNGDALTANMKQLDAGMSLSEKIATVLADVVNSCKDSATADRIKANQDALTEYLAAFWQDDMICEHLIKWQPTGKHSFVNESEDDKVDAEDVNNIVDKSADVASVIGPSIAMPVNWPSFVMTTDIVLPSISMQSNLKSSNALSFKTDLMTSSPSSPSLTMLMQSSTSTS